MREPVILMLELEREHRRRFPGALQSAQHDVALFVRNYGVVASVDE